MLQNLAEIDPFADIPVPVEVRIGSRKTTVAEVVRLAAGSVIAVEKPVGEPLELLIGGIRLGSVEVVVVDETLAVRVIELDRSLSPTSQRMSPAA